MLLKAIQIAWFSVIHLFCLSIAAPLSTISEIYPPGFKPSSCSLGPRRNPWSAAAGVNDNSTAQEVLLLPSENTLCRQIASFTIPVNRELPYNKILPPVLLVLPYTYCLVYELYGELQLFEAATRRLDSQILYRRHVLAQTGPYPCQGSWCYESGEYSEVGFEITIHEEWMMEHLIGSEIAFYQIGPPVMGNRQLNNTSGGNSTGFIAWQ